MKIYILTIICTIMALFVMLTEPAQAQQCKPWPQNQCGNRCGHFNNCSGSRPGAACIDHHSWNEDLNCCEYTGSSWEYDDMCFGDSDTVEVRGSVIGCSGPLQGVKVQWINKDRYTESYQSTPVRETTTDANGNFTMSVGYSADRVFKIEASSNVALSTTGSQACADGGTRARHTYCQHNTMKGVTTEVNFVEANCPQNGRIWGQAFVGSTPVQRSAQVCGSHYQTLNGLNVSWQQEGNPSNAGTTTINNTCEPSNGQPLYQATVPAGTYIVTLSSLPSGWQATNSFGDSQCVGISPNQLRCTVAPGASAPAHFVIAASNTPTPAPPTATPAPETYPVTVNAYEGMVCDAGTSYPSGFSATAGARQFNVSIDSAPISTTATLNLPDSTNDYVVSLSNLAAGWHLSCPANRSVNKINNVANFWVTQAKKPWWQASAGDVYGAELISNIPSDCGEPGSSCQPYLAIGRGTSHAGVVISDKAVDIPHGHAAFGEGANYNALNNLALQQGYSYFTNLTRDYSKHNFTGSTLSSLVDDQTYFAEASGDLSSTSPWVIGDKKRLVVFVGGNLSLSHENPVTVAQGGFVLFVVRGNITIGGNVKQLDGLYIADGAITIQGSENQFVGNGTFVSYATSPGITSYRHLPELENNTKPATLFNYRPDIVMNTPRELRQSSYQWQEVVPKNNP